LHLTEASGTVKAYANLCAALQLQKGWKEIGQNDLWIGACAIAMDKPLLTRNKRHFQAMPGLRLIEIGF
jgi:predicted nucleic acid-binding protein